MKLVAVVEDDLDQRENYADVLAAQGFEIQVYESKAEAQAGFQKILPDLAILDSRKTPKPPKPKNMYVN